jgi:NADPH:quinone reductase
MDIVGNTTLLDSLKTVKKGGYVCNAGFLGGGEPLAFNP